MVSLKIYVMKSGNRETTRGMSNAFAIREPTIVVTFKLNEPHTRRTIGSLESRILATREIEL